MDRQFKNTLRDRLGNYLESKKSATLMEVVLIFEVVFLFIQMVAPFFQGSQLAQQLIVWFANVIMIALVCFGQWLRRSNFRDLGLVLPVWSGKTYLKIILWSFLIGIITILSFVLGSVGMSMLMGATAQPDVSNYDYLKDNPEIFVLSLLGVYLVSSFGEELVYRGFLIHRVSLMLKGAKFEKTYAVLISAVIFGLAHYTWGITGMVQTSFMGLILGTFHVRFKNKLIVLILAHAYMDTLLLGSIYLS